MATRKITTSYEAIVRLVIKRLREEEGVEQRELAKAVGVNPSTWSRIEKGDTGMTLDQLWKAARYFERTPAEVLQIADKLIQTNKTIEIRSKKEIDDLLTEHGKRIYEASSASGLSSVHSEVLSAASLISGALIGGVFNSFFSDLQESDPRRSKKRVKKSSSSK